MGGKVLLFSHDTVGLGHTRRVVSLARRLAAEDPALSALVLTGSTIAHTLRMPPNVDVVKLPSVQKVRNDEYESRRLQMSREEVVRLRSDLVHATFSHFAPDVFIVDKAPLGVHGELEPTLAANREAGRPCRIVLSMRDILDEPEEVIRSWRSNGIHDAITRYYDDILVWGVREIYDPVEQYRLPDTIARKMKFCGFLGTTPEENGGAAPVEAPEAGEPGLPGGVKRFVLATVGGGEDGFDLLRCVLESLRYAREAHATVLVTGPDMPPSRRAEIEKLRRASAHPVFCLDYTPYLERLMEAASVVVTMGGYNTLCEVVSRRKPAVVVPRVRPRTEQLIRARQWEERGLLRLLHPAELDPATMASLVDDALTGRWAMHPSGPSFRGLDVMVETLGPYLRLPSAEPSKEVA